ncbi:hypothetical protein KP509_1Z289900 [Ceratopteris richardii]|nr:hypothetical protein KP509_1Z289900 [Ceratopteris richardii]
MFYGCGQRQDFTQGGGSLPGIVFYRVSSCLKYITYAHVLKHTETNSSVLSCVSGIRPIGGLMLASAVWHLAVTFCHIVFICFQSYPKGYRICILTSIIIFGPLMYNCYIV